MCKKKQFKYCPSEIDECMREEIKELNQAGVITLACCCGHGIYPKTIVIRGGLNWKPWEVFSQKFISREKKFYKKDKKGYYYIPETIRKVGKD